MATQKSSKSAIHVRVLADTTLINQVSEQIGATLEATGSYELVETSVAYICRPPQEDKSRVYLTFVKREGAK